MFKRAHHADQFNFSKNKLLLRNKLGKDRVGVDKARDVVGDVALVVGKCRNADVLRNPERIKGIDSERLQRLRKRTNPDRAWI